MNDVEILPCPCCGSDMIARADQFIHPLTVDIGGCILNGFALSNTRQIFLWNKRDGVPLNDEFEVPVSVEARPVAPPPPPPKQVKLWE